MASPLLPSLTFPRLFVADLLAAPAPCFALGLVEADGQRCGCMAVRPAVPIPAASPDQGFQFGHRVLGRPAAPIFQFSFHFYGHQPYHGLVPPSNPIVQIVIRQMLQTGDYLFFAINPDQTATAFRSELGDRDLAGLETTFAQFGGLACSTDDYERTVTTFARQPDPPGLVLPWVCRMKPAYLDFTEECLQLGALTEPRPTTPPAPADEPAVIWQPLAMLPTLLRRAEESLADAQAQLANVQVAQNRPGVLDGPTVAHAQRVYREQREILALYAEQAQRWADERLSRHQQAMRQHLIAIAEEALEVNAELLALLALLDA